LLAHIPPEIIHETLLEFIPVCNMKSFMTISEKFNSLKSVLPQVRLKRSKLKDAEEKMEITVDTPVKVSVVSKRTRSKSLFHIACNDMAEDQLYRAMHIMHIPLPEGYASANDEINSLSEAIQSLRPLDLSLAVTTEGGTWYTVAHIWSLGNKCCL
jgi:hypothetical protein